MVLNNTHTAAAPAADQALLAQLQTMGRLSHQQADYARREDDPAQVRAALLAEGRAHWESAPTHRLSQGQRQFLCLLAVLLMKPATLLLDEPFAGLDLPTQARLSRRLNAVAQHLQSKMEGTSGVFMAKDLPEALAMLEAASGEENG